MAQHRFMQVDVFTSRAFFGNPVAVVLDADEIDPADMARIAHWTNLSETTFVLRATAPGADYRLRIFTPTGELPFAGHPTIGSAHAVIEAGIAPRGPRLVQECLAGLLPLTITDTDPRREISVRVPTPNVLRDRHPRAECEASLTLSAALGGAVRDSPAPLVIDVGPVWLVAYMERVEDVRRLSPNTTALAELSREAQVTGVTVFALGASHGARVHVRSFAPAAGVPEDPVCGSGNAAVGAYLALTGLLQTIGSTYSATQGTELGRDGHVRVQVEDSGRRIHIGGQAVTVIEGTIRT